MIRMMIVGQISSSEEAKEVESIANTIGCWKSSQSACIKSKRGDVKNE